jgi:shikimate dehydrogenase
MRDFIFLGVNTSHSSAHALFGTWCRLIDVEGRLVGVDIPIGASKEAYQHFLETYLHRENVVGGLVTSHKAALFQHCRSCFSHFTPDAESLEEVGAIFRHGGAWAADAPDIRASTIVTLKLLSTPQWQSGAKRVAIFGAGGAGLALSVAIASLGERPSEIFLTEQRSDRESTVHRILRQMNVANSIEVLPAKRNQGLLDSSPSGTLFVNATGLGKDAPGSPVLSFSKIAEKSLVWDFNYRGDLLFLKQAYEEAEAKNLVVEDGWHYFFCGWAHVMCNVFDRTCTPSVIERFAHAAGCNF